ncbi:MAG: LysR substrate-binding domain-containing protein, partial [Alphaproteobacteria bacterium]
VYQTGSMTVGGELMGVSQPAISRLIRDLEAEIGFPLFERTRGRLTPTADAAEFYREVQRSFHGLDRLGHVARELQQRRVGDLRIASTVAMSFYLLPRVIGRFRQDWPDVKLALHSCPSPEVLECVGTQQYDVGIAVTPSDAPGVTAIDLPALDTVCVLAEDHPLAAKKVIRPRDLDIIMEATNSAPICDLISQKVGLSILEPVTARAFAGRGIVIRPYEPTIPLLMKFVHAANRPLSDRGQAFCALVEEEMETFRAEMP